MEKDVNYKTVIRELKKRKSPLKKWIIPFSVLTILYCCVKIIMPPR